MAVHGSTRALALALIALVVGCETPGPAPFSADVLAAAMSRRPAVLLGEVHDNAAQHAVRAEALRRLFAHGARPALAFEQFDRERQTDVDRARGDALPSGVNRADHLIAQAGGAGWNWNLYRPYLLLALEHDVPIVAANLSRAVAMRVAQQGFSAAFDAPTRAAFGLDRLPAELLRAHEREVDIGHCQLIPPAMLPSLARAQIARDLTLAQSIRPHIARGVVLLTGNGHARNAIAVPYFLSAAERTQTVTIGLLESVGSDANETAMPFDITLLTPTQPRDDPCATLRQRIRRE